MKACPRRRRAVSHQLDSSRRGMRKRCRVGIPHLTVWLQFWWQVVTLHKPSMTPSEVAQQFLILCVPHISRPNDGCMLDVRLVVNPVTVHIVLGSISNDYEMLTGNLP